ncbi:ABC transporter ATP-binding protein [Actinophytocola sp. NPDC049390]|uniref:ABC transporter ATP-binding protein n=1 Tax=Actinophytocola sp. NPDC049390 TaxID=3363894 RepID=UPI0037A0204D
MVDHSPAADQSRHLVRTGWGALVLGWRADPWCALARLGLTVLGAVCAPLVAWFGKLLIDELTRGGTAAAVTLYAVAGAATGALGIVCHHLTGYVRARHDAAVTLRAESDLFARTCAYGGLRYFEDPEFQDRLLLAENSAADGPNSAVDFVEGVVRAIVSMLGFLAFIAAVWPLMAGLLCLAALPGLVAELKLANRHVDASMASSAYQRRRFFYRSLLTDDRAAKEVRLFGLGGHFRRGLLDALHGSQHVLVRLARRTALTQTGLSLLGAAVSGVAIVVVAHRVLRGELTPGDVLLFVSAVAGVQGALSDMVGQVGAATRALKLFRCYLDVMREPLDMTDGDRRTPPLRDALRFENVWFRYHDDAPWVLRGVSFELRAGTALGLVGVNGAGKSTLVKLACRFYDPQRGRVTWDGIDLRDLGHESLRARLAATFQDFMTYDLTVGENIGVGDLSRSGSPEHIQRCAERADIHDAVTRLPRGYDTLLSRTFLLEEEREPGVTFSGGQWQRVALARSLMRADADLLILDEPSASLDADAEHEIHRTLRDFRRGRTSLLISHRLGSVREADHIVVLDDGVITEEGDHDTLMLAGGTYARLFSTQARGYQETTEGSYG